MVDKQQEVKKDEQELAKIMKECMDAPGYVILAGILAPQKDGGQQVNFIYRRYQMSFDDTKNTVKAMQEHFIKDVSEGL